MSGLTALITLDGTHLSEEALHLMPFLADLGVYRVRLLGVWPAADEHDALARPAAMERARNVISAYLADRSRHISPGTKVETVFRAGRPADEIIAEEVDSRADLIVMATHGREGAAHRRLGSVADEVIRRATVPVLIAGPNLRGSLPRYKGRRVVVPLDGLSLSEQALPAARAVAARTGAGVTLLRVVKLDDSWAVSFEEDPEKVMERNEAAARADLEALAENCGWRAEILRAGYEQTVAGEIKRYVEDNDIDLVIMTSPTRPTLERWLLDSVTEEIIRGCVPVLLVKPGELHSSGLFRTDAETAVRGLG